MPDKIEIRKWIIAGVLILHIAWIGNHMRLVATGQINPWQMGGYAMYTIPSPGVRLWVYDAHMPDAPLRVKLVRYGMAITNYGMALTNISRTFRCVDVPVAALLGFFDDNRDLIGRNLAFVYSERQFVRDPPSTKRVIQGTVMVTWQDGQTFTYTNRFCGSEHVASATVPFGFATLP
jgi:hypothetical protein